MSDVKDAKAAKFVEAYIDSGFRASEAAKKCFRIGSKGGKNPQRTAESVGSEYMRKPEVRRYLAERLREREADMAFVFENLLKLAKESSFDRDRIKATELIGKTHAAFIEKQQIESNMIVDIVKSQEEQEFVDWEATSKHLQNLGKSEPMSE